MMHEESPMDVRSETHYVGQAPTPAAGEGLGADEGRQVLIELATSRVAVAVFAEGTPSDEEWGEYLDALQSLGDSSHRTLVLSAGGGPTAAQREDLERLAERQEDVKVAVITRSLVARGMVTALRWFRREANAAFEPGKLDVACDYLGLDAAERRRAAEVAEVLAERLGISEEFGF